MIKRPSLFMIVFIKSPEMRWGLPIILPLFAIGDAVDAVLRLLRVAMWVSPKVRGSLREAFPEGLSPDILWSARDILYGLRQYGSWTLADIATGDGTRVLVRFV